MSRYFTCAQCNVDQLMLRGPPCAGCSAEFCHLCFRRVKNCRKCGTYNICNKENKSPNADKKPSLFGIESRQVCVKCNNPQPIYRICSSCDKAKSYFCVKDECWHIISAKNYSTAQIRMNWNCSLCSGDRAESYDKKYSEEVSKEEALKGIQFEIEVKQGAIRKVPQTEEKKTKRNWWRIGEKKVEKPEKVEKVGDGPIINQEILTDALLELGVFDYHPPTKKNEETKKDENGNDSPVVETTLNEEELQKEIEDASAPTMDFFKLKIREVVQKGFENVYRPDSPEETETNHMGFDENHFNQNVSVDEDLGPMIFYADPPSEDEEDDNALQLLFPAVEQ